MSSPSLGLGTVQFGLAYGVTNTRGLVSEAEAAKILRFAESHGTVIIDTAAAYGKSEEVLGRLIDKTSRFKIVTKTNPIRTSQVTAEGVKRIVSAFNDSLSRLARDRIYSLMVHHAEDLLSRDGKRLYESLLKLQGEKYFEKIGISIYNAGELDRILDRYPVQLVQLPLNIFNQNLWRSGHLKKLKSKNIEIHVRSAFLQGTLLVEPAKLPAHLRDLEPRLQALRNELFKAKVSPLQACLGFLRGIPEVDTVLVGATSLEEFSEINRAWEMTTASSFSIGWERFAVSEEHLINPALWSLGKA